MTDDPERHDWDAKGSLDSWEPQLPPDDFAQRVAQTVERSTKRRRLWPVVVVGLAAAAAVAAVTLYPAPSHGTLTAEARTERALSDEVAVVAEAGSQLKWKGPSTTQSAGDVFYRVDTGTEFRIQTPAGVIEVKGTCFRVRVKPTGKKGERAMTNRGKTKGAALLSAGAAVGALVVVTVYEGRVEASQNGRSVSVAPGESARMDGNGVRKLTSEEIEATDEELAQKSAALKDFAKANQNLAGDVATLKRNLSKVAKQKKDLEKQLSAAQTAAAKAAGEPTRDRPEFDLDADDWKDLAKTGTIKYQLPCLKKDWAPTDEVLADVGLAPDDGETLKDAYARSKNRVWESLRPLCEAAVGSASVADSLGPTTCIHVVIDQSRKKDPKGASEAMRQVAEIRAGMREAPGADAETHPVLQAFMTLTGEMNAFKADLAEDFGPGQAQEIAFAEGMCKHTSVFGGPGPRE